MKRYVWPFILISLGLGLASFTLSCTDPALDPIFYALEKELPLEDDKGLADDIAVQRIAKTGASYFLAANSLYTRTEAGTWSRIEPPEAGALCNSVEIFAGQIVAGFVRENGTGLGLWQSSPSPISWTAISNANINAVGVQIVMLKAVGTNLFISTLNGGNYDLYYTINLSAFSNANWVNRSTSYGPISDVADDGTIGTSYWVTQGPYLYQDTDDTTPDAFVEYPGADKPASEGKPFGGLFYSAANTALYLSSGNGKLFSWNGSSWTASDQLKIDSKVVPFSAFLELPGGPPSDMIVGSKGYGYFQMPGGSITTSGLVRSPSYNISALYNGAINSFFLDAALNQLFACTSGAGLWRADYVSGAWQWKQE